MLIIITKKEKNICIESKDMKKILGANDFEPIITTTVPTNAMAQVTIALNFS